MVLLQNRIDYRPCSFNRILAGKERSIADHGIAQEPFVRCLFAWLLFEQTQLLLNPDKTVSGKFDPHSESNVRVGRDTEP